MHLSVLPSCLLFPCQNFDDDDKEVPFNSLCGDALAAETEERRGRRGEGIKRTLGSDPSLLDKHT